MHFSHNQRCVPASFIANFGNRDPGTQTIWSSLMAIPTPILAVSLSFARNLLEFEWTLQLSVLIRLSTVCCLLVQAALNIDDSQFNSENIIKGLKNRALVRHCLDRPSLMIGHEQIHEASWKELSPIIGQCSCDRRCYVSRYMQHRLRCCQWNRPEPLQQDHATHVGPDSLCPYRPVGQ